MGIMKVLCLLVVIAVASAQPQTAETPDFLSDEFIAIVNAKATTWKAGRNFPLDTPMEYFKNILGVLPRSAKKTKSSLRVKNPETPKGFVMPENFDARENWKNCPVIAEIRDQGSCGSCWAISSAEVMSDRTCIYSEGKKNFHYSTEDIMDCCTECGYGCGGGWPDKAFEYWVKTGIVSGGEYASNEGCKPYTIRPTGFLPKAKNACVRECRDGFRVPYEADLRHASESYLVHGEENIKKEIVNNGPVGADFTVYSDFFDYQSGVYQHTYGGVAGGHAIKIMGFGVEDGTPYWLCANSWGSNWGMAGTFKILRGSNECGIENEIMGGVPKNEIV